jgi:DNA-binding HxlR family transcriptional regulator
MESAPREPTACALLCPDLVRTALEVVAAKWSAPILIELSTAGGPVRYAALQRHLEITAKELAKNLRALEASGLVHRRVHPTVPPGVDYAITPRGRDLMTAVGGLADWAAAGVGRGSGRLP